MSGESRRSVAVELLIWIFDAEKKNRANNMAQLPYLVESLNTFAGLSNHHNSLSWWFNLQWLTLLFLFFYFIFVQLSHVVHFVFTTTQSIQNFQYDIMRTLVPDYIEYSDTFKLKINKPSLVLSILDAVFTVSPNKQ